jgi:hypothetical protein
MSDKQEYWKGTHPRRYVSFSTQVKEFLLCRRGVQNEQ